MNATSLVSLSIPRVVVSFLKWSRQPARNHDSAGQSACRINSSPYFRKNPAKVQSSKSPLQCIQGEQEGGRAGERQEGGRQGRREAGQQGGRAGGRWGRRAVGQEREAGREGLLPVSPSPSQSSAGGPPPSPPPSSSTSSTSLGGRTGVAAPATPALAPKEGGGAAGSLRPQRRNHPWILPVR